MEKIRGFVVSHTHWDREWYLTFQEYRIRLVKVLDKVIKCLKEEPEFKHFMLDGQTSALEDYLEVRRNAEEKIRELVARGKLLVGPWFTQPDEALASPEALVRNLLIGHRMAERFGRVMKVGYLPDTFGHVAQIPQILRGFNIDNVVFTRGLGDEGEKLGFEFIWKAPNGDRAIAIHLVNGYCNANMIGAKMASYSAQIWEAPIGWKSVFLDLYYSDPDVDSREAIGRLEQMTNRILPMTKSGILLLMNGCDHMPPQRGITEVIREANNSGKFELKHSTLEEYIDEVKKFQDKMLEYEGELRGARFHPLLVSSISSRMYLKQMNYRAQAILERYAEPLATIAKMYGFEYPAILLLEAWKEILRNHAHDSIYGSGTDPVHEENEVRFLKAIEIGTNVAYDSIRFLSNLLKFEEDGHAVAKLLVFNPHPYHLTEKVSAFLPVSKGIYRCMDEGGNEIEAIAENEETYWITGSRLEFMAELPPMGFKFFKVYSSASEVKRSDDEPLIIENEYLKVFADPRRGGMLKVEDKETGKVFDGLNIFVDDGDVGDEYNYSPPKELDKIITSEEGEASIDVLKSEVRQSFLIKTTMMIPKYAEGQRRSSESVEIPINVSVDLLAGKRRIDIKVSLENTAEDHRLRVKFSSGLKTEHSYADGQFYVQKRSVNPASEGKNWIEPPPTTHPQLFWVNVNDGNYGLTIASKGLPEYEVKEEGGATIYITLLRAVGWLSRGDLVTRKGHAGPQIMTPEAQCRRGFTFEYSIILHKGDWFSSKAYKEAYSFVYPPLCIAVPEKKDMEAKHGLPVSCLQLEPDSLVLTAFKKAEDSEWIVTRFFNISNVDLEAKIVTGFSFREAWRANLNEEPFSKIASNGMEARLNVRPHEIVTIIFKL